MDVHETRRRNLRSLVEEYANGNLSQFVEVALRGSASYKGLQHVTGPRKARNLGAALARKIEAQLQLERGWMDHDRSGTAHPVTVPGGRSERMVRLAESVESLSPPIRVLVEQLVKALDERSSKARVTGLKLTVHPHPISTTTQVMTMHMQETEIVALCARFRAQAKRFRREADTSAGALDLVRLSAIASSLEWAAVHLAKAADIPLPDVEPQVENPQASPPTKVVYLRNPSAVRVMPTIDVSRVHRAQIEASPNNYYPDCMAYIEAMDEDAARRRIAEAVATLEFIRVEDAKERVSSCRSATDLIEEGVSEDRILRLFEVAKDGGRVTSFVAEPLFLVRRPAVLILKWASLWRELPVAQ